ncbi:transcriptional regulator [Leptospira perolatii]|uniref:Transcriptional regulator n=1 Tax=Leptospira perolatii TaxID=2023191 RepID=A0A2M9ZM86_9LEPT|nr:YafY family protein [Leptospira perolatii]PJZ69732.1 transcriptional regulator [Leptospira perolatii]PJZ73053.1 transcriptional regulator [Leptospira perolatii]
MRADRLISILLHLQAKGRTTSKELSKKLGVSIRTIHRDMDALSVSGVPVYAERGLTGGWTLAEGYRTNLTGMKKEEVISLLVLNSTRIIDDLGKKKDFESAFTKLLAALPPAFRKDAEVARQRILIDSTGWMQAQEDLPSLKILQDAIWEDRKLKIIYEKDEQRREREIEPLGLVAKELTWYLVARSAKEYRTFRVSRIKSAVILSSRFERPKKFELTSYWENWLKDFRTRIPSYPVTILCREQAFAKIKFVPYIKILKSSDVSEGWIKAEVDLETKEWALRSLLMLSSNAIILEPKELKDILIEKVNEIQNLYSLNLESLTKSRGNRDHR